MPATPGASTYCASAAANLTLSPLPLPLRAGKNGVYYGFKLGAPVPWSTAFPFSAGFRHPQYVGGYVSQLGVMLFLANPATLEMGLLPLTVLWFVLYLTNSVVEASGDADA